MCKLCKLMMQCTEDAAANVNEDDTDNGRKSVTKGTKATRERMDKEDSSCATYTLTCSVSSSSQCIMYGLARHVPYCPH